MTTDDVCFERGMNLRHGYLTEYFVDDPEYPGWRLLTEEKEASGST